MVLNEFNGSTTETISGLDKVSNSSWPRNNVSLTTNRDLNVTMSSFQQYDIYFLHTGGYMSIVLSAFSVLVCIVVISVSFKKHGFKLASWKQVQRFVLLHAVTDFFFYLCITCFAVQVTITERVPTAPFCTFYAVMILFFSYSQCRLSIAVAFTAFAALVLGKKLNFGRYDWKLLLFMTADPVVFMTVAATNDGMAFNGYYCGLKEGTGVLWNFLLIFSPLSIVLATMTVLYFVIWFKIYSAGKQIRKTIGEQSNISERVITASRNMTFFILVFILKYSVPAVHGLWVYLEKPPLELYQVTTFATSLGGIFNGVIYLTVRRDHL